MKMKRKTLAVVIAGALAIPAGAQAVEGSFYGQVNRAISFVDDGAGSDVRYVDSSASSSRFGWSGSGDIGNGMQAGLKLEAAWQTNLSGGDTGIKTGDFATSGGAGDVNLRIRHVVGWFSGNWGKLSFGQTSDSFDGAAYADQSGAWLAVEYANDYALAHVFRTSGAAEAGSGVSIFGAQGSLDGGRRDLVKYDSPSFGPVSFTVSAATNSRFDAAVWLDSDVGGGHFLGVVGYSSGAGAVGADLGGSADTISGSASYLFSQGTDIYGAYGTTDSPFGAAAGLDDDPDKWAVALGHSWGNNSARVMFQQGEDFTAGCDSDNIQVGIVHKIPKPKVELYAAYSNNDLECSAAGNAALGFAAGTDYEDIDVFTVGTRIKFD